MIRVWFNHWFRTAFSIISLMKQYDPENIYIIGSHSVEFSPIRTVCDEWYTEKKPDNEDDYTEFCLQFCKEHKVDVFVPHRCMAAISKNKSRFEQLGVKLLSDDFSSIELFENKAKAYEYLKRSSNLNIPDYRVVTNSDSFEQAYSELHKKYENICIKFTNDEGGQSFRKILPHDKGFNSLRAYVNPDISIDVLLKLLRSRRSFDEMIVMPYLDGCEVSVDCLRTDDGEIILPRFKEAAHIETLRFDEEIVSMTKEVLKLTDLQFPCDVQFRYLGGKPFLLEVNARMSGGLPMSCEASGVNIPALALRKLIDGSCSAPEFSHEDRIFSNVEIPKIIV